MIHVHVEVVKNIRIAAADSKRGEKIMLNEQEYKDEIENLSSKKNKIGESL